MVTDRRSANYKTLGVSPLGPTDVCDMCGSLAYGRAVMPSGHQMLFCSHHLAESLPKLRVQADTIYDYREILVNAEARHGS